MNIPKLEQLRLLIDDVDEELLSILSKRMKIIKEMGDCKRENNMSILQLDRWITMLKVRLDMGKANGLDEEFLRELWKIIHSESIKTQEQ